MAASIDRITIANAIASRKHAPEDHARLWQHLNFLDKIGDCPTPATAQPTLMNTDPNGPVTVTPPAGYPAALIAALKASG